MASLKTLRARWRSDSGAEFVEMALAFPILLLVVLGIMDFGIMFQQYQVITNAAREGARVAVLPDYDPDVDATARAQDYISRSFLAGDGTTTPTVVVTPAETGLFSGHCMSTYTVTVTYPHEFIFISGIGRFFNTEFGTKTLTASSTMRAETAAGGC